MSSGPWYVTYCDGDDDSDHQLVTEQYYFVLSLVQNSVYQLVSFIVHE